jgi:hypothetical protein
MFANVKSFIQCGLGIFLLPLMAMQSYATTLPLSNWDNPGAGADGWSFVNDGSNLKLVLTGGNGGGFLQITDQALGTTIYFVAPSKFLGNQSAAYAGSLSFDLQQSYDTNYFADDDVLLTGNGTTLAYFHGLNPAIGSSWTTISVPLTASAGWKVGTYTGAAATEAQLQSVLANLTALWIRPEFQVGPDVDGMDNVKLLGNSQGLAPTPELSSWMMLTIGLGCAYLKRRL